MELFGPSKEKKAAAKEQAARRVDELIAGSLPSGGEDEYMHKVEMEQRSDLIRWQQNLEPELQKYYYDIKGWENTGTEDTPNWKPIDPSEPDKYALANEYFLKRSCALARSLLSKNLIMSSYSELRIMSNLRDTMTDFRADLLQNRTKYNISQEDYTIVVGIFKVMIEAAHFRALNNGERRYLSEIGKRIETHTDQPAEKKGFLGLGR